MSYQKNGRRQHVPGRRIRVATIVVVVGDAARQDDQVEIVHHGLLRTRQPSCEGPLEARHGPAIVCERGAPAHITGAVGHERDRPFRRSGLRLHSEQRQHHGRQRDRSPHFASHAKSTTRCELRAGGETHEPTVRRSKRTRCGKRTQRALCNASCMSPGEGGEL
jgi:hypothetical protein